MEKKATGSAQFTPMDLYMPAYVGIKSEHILFNPDCDKSTLMCIYVSVL